MRTISSAMQLARHKLLSGEAWLFLVEIPVSTGAYFRLVSGSRHVEAGGKIWQAAGLSIELGAEEAEGSLPAIVCGVPNVSRVPMAYVEQDVGSTGVGELVGRELTCWLAHESDLASLSDGASWRHLIVRATANEKEMRVECGHPAQVQRIPSQVYTRREFPQLLATGVR